MVAGPTWPNRVFVHTGTSLGYTTNSIGNNWDQRRLLRFLGRGFGFIEPCDGAEHVVVYISQIVAGGELRRRLGFFVISPILGCRFPWGPLPVPIAAFCARRNWSIFCGLYRGQSFAKGEPNESKHH
jgi:hypothetical protein